MLDEIEAIIYGSGQSIVGPALEQLRQARHKQQTTTLVFDWILALIFTATRSLICVCSSVRFRHGVIFGKRDTRY